MVSESPCHSGSTLCTTSGELSSVCFFLGVYTQKKVPVRFLSPSKVRGGPITAIYGRRPVSDEAEIMVCLQEAVFPRILFNWLVSMGLFFSRHGLGLTLR